MDRSVDVAIIGAGQAGLATSWGTVIWTSGYRPEYDWVKFPVFDEMGFPVQVDGRTSVPGLYFVGVNWMRKMKSAVLYGVGEDAEVVARHIVGNHS